MNPKPKMMPGQEPYTDEEFERLNKLLDDACESDPGEENEPDWNKLWYDTSKELE